VTPSELRVIQGPDTGRRVDVSGVVVIGRDSSADLVLADDQVSRRHLQVALADGGAVVEDLGSTNGTYLDGRLVTGRQALPPRARIQAGNTLLEYAAPVQATSVRLIPTEFERARRQQPVPTPPAQAGVQPAVAAPPQAPPAAAPAPAAPAAPPGAPPAPAAPPPAAAPAVPAAAWNGIEVYGLIREFKGGFRAVNELYLQVHPGEVYGFLGPNGAGKSTTVHMLTTLLPPSGGTAHVAGYDVAKNPADVRRAIGVALQEASLDPLLNAYEHMQLQCAMQSLPRREWKRRGEELIERVKLTEAAGRRVGGYSGGMKRRLDLALALVHRPRILFLDEPTTGLDPKSRGDLWDEVAHLAKDEGVTVFLTTQYLEEADMLADRVGIIDHGELVTEGTPAALKAEIGKPTAEIVPVDPSDGPAIAAVMRSFGAPAVSTKGVAVQLERGPEALADLVRALDEARLRLANVQLHAPTLDDVFLKKTGRSLEEQTLQQSGAIQIPPRPGAG
jgi:ABC-2 type transport system ATP-binding protein